MPTEIKAWKCAFCKKYYMSKGAANHHEKKCFHNPATKSCITCGNFLTVHETVYVPPSDGDPGSSDYDIQVNVCDHFKQNFNDAPSGKRGVHFQTKCTHWIPIKCSRDCDWCKTECVLNGTKESE